jgi:dipeptidyl aminopeptidase/acylaminoacyl peptidase
MQANARLAALIGGGVQMYEALRTLEVPTQLVIYPGQSHVFTRPSYIRDKMQRFIDWFARYLGPPGAR